MSRFSVGSIASMTLDAVITETIFISDPHAGHKSGAAMRIVLVVLGSATLVAIPYSIVTLRRRFME